MGLERIVIEVSGDPKKLKSTISELQKVGIIDDKNAKKFKENNIKFQKGVNQSKQSLGGFKNALAGVGVALTATFAIQKVTQGLKAIINTSMAFEAQMSRVKAITGATDKEFKKLKKSAEDLGGSTKFTATEIGQLQEAYGKLGFTTKEILAATEATTQLAVATGESLSGSAEVAGSTLRAFGLDATEMQRVVDVMAASFTSSALDLESFRESMKLVAPIAKAANIPIETTTALLGKLADSGLKGSLAGTTLKNLLSKLADENSDLSKSLGFSVKNTDDLFRAFQQLKQGNIDLTKATELTDERSKAGFLTFIDGIDSVEQLTEKLNEAKGSAKEMADTVEDNLEGDITKLNSAIDAVSRAIGDSFKPTLRSSTQTLTRFAGWIQRNGSTLKTFGKFIAMAASYLVGYKGVLIAVNLRTKLYSFLTKKATFTTKGFSRALMSNPLGLFVGLLASGVSALFLFKSATEDATEEEDEFNDELDETNKALNEQVLVLATLRTKQGAGKLTLQQLQTALATTEKKLSELSEKTVEATITAENFFDQILAGREPNSTLSEGIEQIRDKLLGEIKALKAAIKEKERYLAGNKDQTDSIAKLKKRLSAVTKEMLNQALVGKISTESLEEFKRITNELTGAQNKLRQAIKDTSNDISEHLIPDEEIEEDLATLSDAIDTILENIVGAVDEAGDMVIKISGMAADEAIKEAERITKRLEEERQKRIEQARSAEETMRDLTIDTINFIYDIKRQNLDQELIDLETQKEFELKIAGDNAQARENIEKKFAEEEKKIRQKQAQTDKDQAAFNAALSTFTAAAKALEIGGIVGPILAALITALGIAQQIKIANTPLPKFEKGGFIEGQRHSQGGTMVEAERDEFIVNRIAAKRNKDLLQDLNSGKMIAYNRPKNIAGTFAENVAASLSFNDQNLLRAIKTASRKEVEAFYTLSEAIQDRPNPRRV